ncbi:hypothetical protein QR680_010224 [Steinernema hermaphroditum]|uniref:G-protein coupled receptors family 1 profile domain-containing protein n=1 Tax=Steinernema hermaphroditum TaxID=289476 RepID=A0AA39IN84_9BILA|nr:hypothetical protein QR680_010224 [Steinernema hermaphroditum]
MSHRLLIATYNLSIFAVFFPLNMAILWVILRCKEFRNLWAYRVIAHIAVADVVLLIVTASAGLMTALGKEIPGFLTNVLFATSISIKETQFLLSLALAINRFIVILRIDVLDKPALYHTLIAISWLTGIGMITAALMTLRSSEYVLLAFYFTGDFLFYKAYESIAFIFNIAVSGVSMLLYVIIILSINLKKKAVSRQEFYLFLQAIIPFLWLLTIEGLMYFKRSDAIDSALFGLLFNLFQRFVPAVHVIIYLVFNRKLRGEVAKSSTLLRNSLGSIFKKKSRIGWA